MLFSNRGQGYAASANALGGAGKFNRMKEALNSHAEQQVPNLFSESSKVILDAVTNLIREIGQKIVQIGIQKTMHQVYSTIWENQTNASENSDPVYLQQVRECRDSMLPLLNAVREAHNATMDALGLDREDFELDVIGVENLDTRLENAYQEAVSKNEVIDLCDSDAEMPSPPRKPTSLSRAVAQIKRDPGAPHTAADCAVCKKSCADRTIAQIEPFHVRKYLKLKYGRSGQVCGPCVTKYRNSMAADYKV